MPSVDNILVGHADVYVKAYATDNDPVSSNAVSWDGWTQLGYQTEDGLEFSYEPEYFDVSVHSYNTPVKTYLVGEELMVKFTLQESALSQMQYAIPGSTYTVGATPGTNENTLTIGDKATVSYYSLGFEGVASTGNEFIIFVPKVLSVASVGIPFQRKGVRVVPAEFKAFADSNESAGERLCKMYEITSADS